jgi:hypothetical protein
VRPSWYFLVSFSLLCVEGRDFFGVIGKRLQAGERCFFFGGAMRYFS